MLYLAGVPTLAEVQSARKEMKRAKKGPVQLEDLHDLKLLAVEATRPLELMPPLGTTVATATAPAAPHHDSKLIHVPMDCAAYNTEGLVVTGPVQMRWLQQLLERPRQFVLHVDGKHKLHHGGWVLMTVGTHRLRWDEHHHKLSTSFVPLMYQMCKQVESGSATTLGSAHMLLDSLNVACDTAFGKRLEPGAGVSDHCPAYFNAYEHAFPGMPRMQCYPHIARKLAEGEYRPKTWEHFDAVTGHVRAIHLAMSASMRNLLLREIGLVWDKLGGGKHMDKFWNVNCIDPWNTWSVGLFDAPLCTPSNNTQEAWHRDLLRGRIPGMFRGSTEAVFKVALPQLAELDGLLAPTELPFEVPAIPKAMMQNALWYVANQATHMEAFEMADGVPAFYVMSRSNAGGAKRFTKKHHEMFQRAMLGELDSRIKDLASLIQVCQSVHIVCTPADGYEVLTCDGNPCKYECLACKTFKGVGICSHVLAINHILQKFNLRYELKQLQTRASKKQAAKGGNTKRPLPALQRAPVAQPDSSDEEDEAHLALGEQGK